MIATPIKQKLYSAGGAPGSFPDIGSWEDSNMEIVHQIILSILHFQFAFTLGLDEHISK